MRKHANRNYQVMSHDGTFLQVIIQVGIWAQEASLPYVPYGASFCCLSTMELIHFTEYVSNIFPYKDPSVF